MIEPKLFIQILLSLAALLAVILAIRLTKRLVRRFGRKHEFQERRFFYVNNLILQRPVQIKR
ncbi:MAG: hypothetical protein ACQER7_02770 [Bacteroidota bacterium]